MKNKFKAFLSLFFVVSTCLIGCKNDDNEVQIPTSEVTTAKQYKDLETANTEINSMVEDVFSTESGLIPVTRNSANKMIDCATITSESTDGTRTILINFEDGCEINGESISGSIRMSFAIVLDTENKVVINYVLENLVYKGIAIAGTANTTFTFRSETGNTAFSTSTNFSFAWEDGLTATSESNFVKETFFDRNPDNPQDSEYYKLTSGSSSTRFSNGDQYGVEITTPLRNERGCAYTVSGVIVTTQNSEVITLDYGDGTCDNTATQTDGEGNETTIEL
ncbi:hypothetical protein [Aquimarina mytili]|uniref:Uncharacterized protein n=1 Tax=Aquimarina mytili TaxID=874423 RepID=A0A936ZZN5_9FLAO|nr:hypothetical protein [Aquimarina mytili]MBL0684840.1 hypothetical protein [Aquimarina mytili]